MGRIEARRAWVFASVLVCAGFFAQTAVKAGDAEPVEGHFSSSEALGLDDECADDGAGVGHCALSALQLRGQRMSTLDKGVEVPPADPLDEDGADSSGVAAAAYFDHYVVKAGLSQELTASELHAYRLRFIDRANGLLGAGSAKPAMLATEMSQLLEATRPAVTEKIAEAVNRNTSGWTAGVPTWAKNLTLEDFRHMLGHEDDPNLERVDASLGAGGDSEDLPEAFDSREKWPHCRGVMSHVRNQGLCNSCWAHAAAASLETRICVATDGRFSGSRAWISAAYITSCYADIYPGHDGCSGGNPGKALERASRGGLGGGGVPTGSSSQNTCVPYFGSGNPLDHFWGKKQEAPACPTECTSKDGYPRSLNDDKFYTVGQVLTTKDLDMFKRAVLSGGPVPVSFVVYNDFMMYMGGYYDHSWGEKVGQHATAALGWTRRNGKDFILGVNQWGTFWGEGGFFTMAVDCCNFEYYLPQVDGTQEALPLPSSSDDGVCQRKTGGTCVFSNCHASRGPTNCEMAQCVCRPGYCAEGGTCVASKTAVVLAEAAPTNNPLKRTS